MSLAQIEFRALRAIDRVRKGARQEDDGVEFKTLLLDDCLKAARRIAAMANAAQGEQFLWIVGVDGKTGKVNAIEGDPASWWEQVASRFQSEPPVIRIAHAEEALVLAFESPAPPYVVRTAHVENEKGIPTHEVPWREGTRTRTALHSDLLRMLVPSLRAPEIEVMSGEVNMGSANSPTGWVMRGTLKLFVTPRSSELVTLPAHRASVSIQDDDGGSLVDEVHGLRFNLVQGSLAEASNSSQLYCRGPGVAELLFGSTPDGARLRDAGELIVSGYLTPAPEGPPARLRARLSRVTGTAADNMIWR